MASGDPKRRVLAYCYGALALRPTHARMTEREFARFDKPLVFWCPSCNAAHTAAGAELQLEPAHPPAGPGPATGATPSGVRAPRP